MKPNYFQCDLCFAQLMQGTATNQNKFPVTRRFQDDDTETGLISVRCAECTDFPFLLEEGQPYRVKLIGQDKTTVNVGLKSSQYNYWPYGFGHLLEIFPSNLSEDYLSSIRNEPIELGFISEKDVNLIAIAFRGGYHKWNVTPYSWYDRKEWKRGTPPLNPSSEEDLRFTVAVVNTHGGKYVAIRSGLLTPEFASCFHNELHKQIERGEPNWKSFKEQFTQLFNLSIKDQITSMLQARCYIH